MIWAVDLRGQARATARRAAAAGAAPTSARPSASICRSPPESWWPAVLAAAGQRLEQLVDLVHGPLGVGPVASPQPAEAQVLVHGQLGDHAAALGHVRHAAADQLLDRDLAQVAAVEA